MDFSSRPGYARRSPAQGSSSSSALARTGSSGIQTQLSHVLAAAKQHEQLCAQLEEGSRLLEEQLHCLRAEHEALRADHDDLRATLSRSGVLRGGKEPSGCAGANGLAAYSAAVQRQPAGPACSRGKPAAARTKSAEQLASASSRDGGARGAERGAHRAPAERAPARGRSESRCQPLGPRAASAEERLDAGRGGQPYGRTSALRAYSQPADGWSESEDDAADGQDEQASLNGLLESALEAPGDAHGQQRELVALQRFLKGGPMALSAWSGPGTPLGAAVRSGRSDVARMLLKAHADPNEKDPKGVSALHLAAFDGSVDLCKVILFAHAHVDQRDRHGQTPLFFAPSAAVCKVLIESNSDVRVLNRKGQSALHLAGRAGLCEVLEWLGSRVSRSLFELKDLHGATASDYLEQSGAVPKPAAAEGPERGQPQSQRPPSPPASPRRASPALRGRAEGLPQALAEDEAQARRPAAPKASSQAPRITVISAAKESSAVPSAPRSWSQSGQWLAPPSARRSRGSYSGPKCIVDERRHSGAAAPAPAAPPAVQAPAVHAPGPRILDLRQDPHRSSRGSIGGHDPGRQEAAGERRSFSLFNVGGRAPPPRQMPPGAGGRAAGGQAEDLALEAAAALATAAVTAAAAGMQAVSMQEAAASAIAPQAADEDFDNDADHWPVQVMDSTARHQLEQASEDVFMGGDIEEHDERGADGAEASTAHETSVSCEVVSRLFEETPDSVF